MPLLVSHTRELVNYLALELDRKWTELRASRRLTTQPNHFRRLVTMNPNRGNNSPSGIPPWPSRAAPFSQLAAWFRKLLYLTTGLFRTYTGASCRDDHGFSGGALRMRHGQAAARPEERGSLMAGVAALRRSTTSPMGSASDGVGIPATEKQPLPVL